MSDTDDTLSPEEKLAKEHRKERKNLQAEIQRLKHSVPKGDKKKKKEVTAQIAQLEAELDQRHEQELQDLKNNPTSAQGDGGIPEVKDLSLDDDAGAEAAGATSKPQPAIQSRGGRGGKQSKAQRRREKRSEQERQREERIQQQAIENLHGARHIEATKLKALLTARTLRVSQIPSDGDCLYAAIGHQLQQLGKEVGVASLRRDAANHMRLHQDDFQPFLCHTNTGDPYTQEDFEKYCNRVESTTEWGGQLEVQALSSVLQHPIEVIQAEGPSIQVGEGFTSPTLLLSYHRHAYGLGEHYNSVVPGVEEEEEEEGGEGEGAGAFS